MSTVLGDALQKALDSKKNDYSNFVWKGEKIKDGDKFVQKSEKLIDMTPERLKQCYKHCEKMLNNDNPKHYGRYNVLKQVSEQINKCNVELFLRYKENSYLHDERRTSTPRTPNFILSLRDYMSNHPEVKDWSKVPIPASGLPSEFENINVADALDGCIKDLGALDKQHLTMTFITKMGLWFTKAEESELKGETNSNAERLRIAKEKLHLPSKLVLKFNEKGLSYHEMRAMLILPKKQRYSDMTTEQLVTLRNKVLFRLMKQIEGHIYSWRMLQRQIELVARSKGIDLDDQN